MHLLTIWFYIHCLPWKFPSTKPTDVNKKNSRSPTGEVTLVTGSSGFSSFQGLVYDHDCSQTPDHTQVDGGGNTLIVDQRYNYIYVKASLSTATGTGFLSNASTFFCSPLPAAPVLQVHSSDSDQITLTWPNPELYNAPLIGYNIFLDDGLGGDLLLHHYVPADDVAYDETNESVLLSIHPVTYGRWYRASVTVASAAGNTTALSAVSAQACAAPPNPVLERLSSATSLVVTWNASVTAKICAAHSNLAAIKKVKNWWFLICFFCKFALGVLSKIGTLGGVATPKKLDVVPPSPRLCGGVGAHQLHRNWWSESKLGFIKFRSPWCSSAFLPATWLDPWDGEVEREWG